MNKQWHGGKGDSPRKHNMDAYEAGWERIFGNKTCVICGKPFDPLCQWSSCKQANSKKESGK